MRFLCTAIAFLVITSSSMSWSSFDASAFFLKPKVTSAKLSPDGNHVVVISNDDKGQSLVLINSQSGKKTVLLNLTEFSEKDTTVRAVTWVDNEHIATQFSQVKKGVKDLLDTKNVQYLFIIGLPKPGSENVKIFSVRTKGWMVDPLPKERDTFLYAKSGAYSKVYKIKVSQLNKYNQKLNKLTKKDGGQFKKINEVASVEGFATRWFIDHNGSPAAVLNYVKNSNLELTAFDEKGNSKVLNVWLKKELTPSKDELSLSSRILPVALAEEENTFYALDFAEEEERSVYKVNYAKSEESLVFETASFKIIDLILSRTENTLIGVEVLKAGGIHNVYLDQASSQVNGKQTASTKKIMLDSMIGSSLDGTYALYFKESYKQPGNYVLVNHKTNKKRYIGSAYPHLMNKLDNKLVEKSIRVEGLDIPYLLLLPKTKKDKKVPLIVFPHGGPIGVFDHRYFDLTSQFLVANGYAVLRVNFRGSSGYTSELKEAGKKQWGDLMLTDIHQAALHVSKMPEIDNNKICSLGMSYGGYAATMLTILYPQTYQCGVNIAGVSDINLYLNTRSISSQSSAWFIEHVGDVSTDYDKLKSKSPAYLIKRLQRPLFVIHGAKDNVVDIEHAYRLKMMLDKFQKPYSWHIFDEGDHSFGEPEDQALLFSKIITFIQNHTNQSVDK